MAQLLQVIIIMTTRTILLKEMHLRNLGDKKINTIRENLISNHPLKHMNKKSNHKNISDMKKKGKEDKEISR